MKYEIFESFLKYYQQLAKQFCPNQMVVELSLEMISMLNKQFVLQLLLLHPNITCFKLQNLFLGAIVNHNNYIEHFSVKDYCNANCSKHMECEIKFNKNLFTVYFNLGSKKQV